jgi:hypothetical protein
MSREPHLGLSPCIPQLFARQPRLTGLAISHCGKTVAPLPQTTGPNRHRKETIEPVLSVIDDG